MSIALLVRIEGLERRLAAMEAEMVRLRATAISDTVPAKPSPAKKKTR